RGLGAAALPDRGARADARARRDRRGSGHGRDGALLRRQVREPRHGRQRDGPPLERLLRAADPLAAPRAARRAVGRDLGQRGLRRRRPRRHRLAHHGRPAGYGTAGAGLMEVVLRDLALSDEPAFLRAVSAWPPGESLVFAPAYASGMPFADYVALLEAHARGEQLPERWVPSRTMFGFCGALLVGRLQLRLERNDFLLRVGGQIGYAVLPELRGRGCAGSMLRQAI